MAGLTKSKVRADVSVPKPCNPIGNTSLSNNRFELIGMDFPPIGPIATIAATGKENICGINGRDL